MAAGIGALASGANPYLAIGGAALGIGAGIAGAVDTGKQDAASRFRHQFQRGIKYGEAEAVGAVQAIQGSPEYQAYSAFLGNLYGYGTQGQPGTGGLDNPYQVGGEYYLGNPALSKPGTGGTQRAGQGRQMARDYANIQRAQALKTAQEQGAQLKPGEAKFVEKYTNEAYLTDVYARSNALTSAQQYAMGEKLKKMGIGAQDYTATRDALSAAAGVDVGGDMAVAGGPQDNPYGMVGANPMSAQYQKALQLAQSQRGLYESNAAAAAEASGMSAFIYQQQVALLPQLLGLASYGTDKMYGIEQYAIGKNVQYTTGGLGVFGQSNPYAYAPPQTSAGIAGDIMGTVAQGAGMAGSSLNAMAQGEASTNYLNAIAGYMA